MRIKACALALLVPIVSILIAIAAGSPFAPPPANATPGFARQTGVSCQACHTVFPELTPFGRKFKLNAYVFTNVKQLQATDEQSQRTLALSEFPPLSVQLQASNTTLGRSVPDAGVVGDLSQKNDTQFPQALSLFYTGKIADNLGAFVQLTWNPSSNAVGIDNSDLRFANHADFDSIGVSDFIYGLTLNNNPTSQDIWNSTPAWGYPFISSNVGVPPILQGSPRRSARPGVGWPRRLSVPIRSSLSGSERLPIGPDQFHQCDDRRPGAAGQHGALGTDQRRGGALLARRVGTGLG